MIKSNEPLSLSEASEYIKKAKDDDTETVGFVKKFLRLNAEDSKKLRKELENLNLIKLNSKSTTKIIDFLPEDGEDLNKIFTDITLNEDEANKIIDTVKEFK